MTVDISDERAYQYLTLCIQEFERAALESGKRAGYLAVTRGTTHGADVILDAHERSVNRVADARSKVRRSESDQNEQSDGVSAGTDTSVESNPPPQNITLIEGDVDLGELFGGADSPVANYLEECLGCSLRLQFDWQLKPLNLLGPINAFLDSLMNQLDNLLGRIDPFGMLQDLCWALNQLKTLCPQDIILLLAALKALIKKYLLNMFNVRLDWTTLLGPLLQAIVNALSDLFDNIFALLMAPLDCAVAGMRAANDLLRASEQFVGTVQAAGAQVGDFFSNIAQDGLGNTLIDQESSGGLVKDVSWTEPDPTFKADPLAYFNSGAGPSPLSPGNQGYDPGRLEVKNTLNPFSDESPDAPPEDALRIATGFQLTSNMSMLDAIKDPNFGSSTFLEKIIIPIQEVIAWIRETYQKFMDALTSLTGLVSGSMGISFDNLGVLLFLADLISLVMMIYKLIKANLGVKDWCTYLQNNPQVLEEALRGRYGTSVSVQSRGTGDQAELIIKQGPTVAGTVKTCVNARTPSEASVISSWIRELEVRGARQ